MVRKVISKRVTMTTDIEREMERLAERAHDAVSDFLVEEQGAVLAASQEIVPVASGELQRSGHLEGPETKNDVVSVSVVYDARHALPVHETVIPFLERPFVERMFGLSGRMAAALKRVF
jgi:hypothetical protein